MPVFKPTPVSEKQHIEQEEAAIAGKMQHTTDLSLASTANESPRSVQLETNSMTSTPSWPSPDRPDLKTCTVSANGTTGAPTMHRRHSFDAVDSTHEEEDTQDSLTRWHSSPRTGDARAAVVTISGFPKPQSTCKVDCSPHKPHRRSRTSVSSSTYCSEDRMSTPRLPLPVLLEQPVQLNNGSDSHPSNRDKDDDIPKLPTRKYSKSSVDGAAGAGTPKGADDAETIAEAIAEPDLTKHDYNDIFNETSSAMTGVASTQFAGSDCTHTERVMLVLQKFRKTTRVGKEIALPQQDSEWMLENYDVATTVEHVHSPLLEMERVQLLHHLYPGLANAEADPELDVIVCSAQALFGVPISAVCIIDEQWLWYKSLQGYDDNNDFDKMPRNISFCCHTIYRKPALARRPLVIPDCTQDIRVKNNPFVTGPAHIRFYAALPLYCPHTRKALGSFCLIDTEVHPEGLSPEQQHTLQNLADRAMGRIMENYYCKSNE